MFSIKTLETRNLNIRHILYRLILLIPHIYIFTQIAPMRAMLRAKAQCLFVSVLENMQNEHFNGIQYTVSITTKNIATYSELTDEGDCFT